MTWAPTQHSYRISHEEFHLALSDMDNPPLAMSPQGGKERGGILIQTGSSLHSQLKKRIRRFNGVATKCPGHHLAFFLSRDTDPVPLLTEQAGWASARSLREMRMALT